MKNLAQTLSRHLSKRDLVALLEISWRTLSTKDECGIRSVILKLQELVSFEGAFGAHGAVRGMDFTYINMKYPEEYLKEYFGGNLQLIDPIAHQIFSTFEFVPWEDTIKQDPFWRKNPVYLLSLDFHLGWGFTYAVHDMDSTSLTSFSFSRHEGRIDERTKIIIKYAVPFVSEIYKRMDTKRKGIASSPLTPRELEILNWIKEGKTSWEIGTILGISERTVNYHVSNITRKLNAMNRNHAVAIAISQGLVEF